MNVEKTPAAMDVGSAQFEEGQKTSAAMDVGSAEGQKTPAALDVGTAFEDFKAVEDCFDKLKKEHYHPLHVFNSQECPRLQQKAGKHQKPETCRLREDSLYVLVYDVSTTVNHDLVVRVA